MICFLLSGHDVEVFEKAKGLGGTWNIDGDLRGKACMTTFPRSYIIKHIIVLSHHKMINTSQITNHIIK